MLNASLVSKLWKIFHRIRFSLAISSGETRKINQKLEVFNKIFCVLSLVSFVFFNKWNAWKTCKCFWFRLKTFLLKKNIFCLIFFISPLVFPPLQDTWFKHLAKKMYTKFKKIWFFYGFSTDPKLTLSSCKKS